MADNVAVTAGSGTTIAADDVGGVLHQRVKISQGADGSATDVSSAAPLQVTLANTGANATPVVVDLGANNDVTVTGTVTVDLSTNNDVTVTNATATNLKAEVVGTGTFVTQVDGAALTALQLIDDVVYVDDTATHSTGTSKGVGIMAAATPTDGSVSANDIGMVAMSVSRALHVETQGITTISGTVDLGATDNAVLDSIVVAIEGDVAHSDVDTGNGSKISAVATATLAGATLVSAADRTDLYAGIDGVLITRPYCNLEDIISGVSSSITDGSSTSVIASQGAGVKSYITTCIISNDSDTNVTVDIRDGAAGTVKATIPVPAVTSGIDGFVHSFPVPLAFSAATAVCADPSAATSNGGIVVTLIGFKSKV
jgi:hypothetical protein